MLKTRKKKLKRSKKSKWFKLKLFLLTKLVLIGAVGCFVYGIVEGRKTAVRYYTDLPNSCFVESMIHASRANLLLGMETGLYSSVYGFTYYYRDDYEQNKQKAKIFGHAVCIFEYKNILWVYDANWGTMPVGKVTARSQYDRMLRQHVEKYYEYKIVKSFVVEDWRLPEP